MQYIFIEIFFPFGEEGGGGGAGNEKMLLLILKVIAFGK